VGKHTETLLNVLVSNYVTMYFEWETHWNFVECTCFKLCNEVFWVGTHWNFVEYTCIKLCNDVFWVGNTL